MKRVYGLLFLLIGVFNMYVGVVIYDSGYYRIMNFFNNFLSTSQNYFPFIVFAVGLVYFFIGIGLILGKPKSKQKEIKSY